MNVGTLCEYLDSLAPSALAEEWDNVGLLVGDRSHTVQRVMTCLTMTPTTVAEAIAGKADLIVTHHPLPFRPLSRITADTTSGRLLLQVISNQIAVYSAHTAFDSAADGINAQLARVLELRDVRPLLTAGERAESLGTGRIGTLVQPKTLAELACRLKERLRIEVCRGVGDGASIVQCVAIACGSGGSLLEAAITEGCDAFVTGEASFHSCLEAEARAVSLLLVGHFASERFAMDALAAVLCAAFPGLKVWGSRTEKDPIVAW